MTTFATHYRDLMDSLGVPSLNIPCAGVKLYRQGQDIPEAVNACSTASLTFTSCQALRQASLGDPILLTRENIGCIAAGISLGLIDQNQAEPMSGPRVYTEVIHASSGKGEDFVPPAPKDFTDGLVYACHDAGRTDFCLFGEADSGRFKDVETARRAVAAMTAIRPADMAGVFFFPPDFEDIEIAPDVVVLSTRPVELARIIQAWQYETGKRINASMGAVRAVNSDLVARPYLTGEPNVSTYCVGARLIGQFEADRLGIGLPWADFLLTVTASQAARTGYPFHLYPGATDF